MAGENVCWLRGTGMVVWLVGGMVKYLILNMFYWLEGDLVARGEMIFFDREMLCWLGWGFFLGGGDGCLLTGKRWTSRLMEMVCWLLLVVGKWFVG
jgi:hypothetical protein